MIAENDLSLKQIWETLTERYSLDKGVGESLWKELVLFYTSTGRFYHNLSHLEAMARQVVKYRSLLEDVDAVLFALFYHDIIYNINQGDNEKKSGEECIAALKKLNVPDKRIQKCYKLILCTEKHTSQGDFDSDFFLDTDLLILGASSKEYRQYSEQIRKEYSVYNDREYNQGRIAVLKHFLSADRIYKTETFYTLYEEQARINLKEELKTLTERPE